MLLGDINNPGDPAVSWKEAISQSLSPKGGLYLPLELPKISFDELREIGPQPDLGKVASLLIPKLFSGALPKEQLAELAQKAFNFKAELVPLGPKIYSMELFHGPTAAFKDFGARMMAELVTVLHNQDHQSRQLNILTATSGDTGGAVAAAFYQRKNIKVTVLYPKGRVSPLQEQQFSTLGGNISAIEVAGDFDDCQRLVKQAFQDQELRSKVLLSSANSINVARLLPQVCYYVWCYLELARKLNLDFSHQINISIPSGNFGNLVAALIAKKIGIPINYLIAASNANRPFLDYLITGNYQPKTTIPTLSNAMDVGSPNNMPRLMHLCNNDIKEIKNKITSYSFSDSENLATMQQVWNHYGYCLDPHGAIGFKGMENFINDHNIQHNLNVFLHTAHPAKFSSVVELLNGVKISTHPELAKLGSKPLIKTELEVSYDGLRKFLIED